MASSRGKRIAVGAIVAGAGVAVTLLIAAWGWIREEILIRRLENGDREAATRLGELRSVRGVPHLVGAMRDRTDNLLEPSADALSRIGKPAVRPVMELLEDKSASLKSRSYAAEVLGKIGADAAPALGAMAEFANNRFYEPGCRMRAMTALGAIGVPTGEVLRTLAVAVSSGMETSDHAAYVLLKLGCTARDAIPPVLLALESPFEDDLDGLMNRQDLLRTLLHIGPPGKPAIPLLVRHLSHRALAVRIAVVECLGAMEEDAGEAEVELKRLRAEGTPQDQRAASVALRKIAAGRATEHSGTE